MSGPGQGWEETPVQVRVVSFVSYSPPPAACNPGGKGLEPPPEVFSFVFQALGPLLNSLTPPSPSPSPILPAWTEAPPPARPGRGESAGHC